MRPVLVFAGGAAAIAAVLTVAALGQSRHDRAVQVAECASARAHIAAGDHLTEPGAMYESTALWCKTQRL